MQQETQNDARFVHIGMLPSYYLPYEWKALNVRPFTVKELRLIAGAIVTGDMSPLIKAVDLVIDQDAQQLAISDFFYVLMWLRINSYPKTPWEVAWTCSNVIGWDKASDTRIDHDVLNAMTQAEIAAGVEFRPCGSHNASIVANTTVDIVDLEELATTDWQLPSELDFPRVPLLNELYALGRNHEQADLHYIVPAAQWVKNGETLAEKIEWLEEQPNLDLFDAAWEINRTVVFGIKEQMKLRCDKCGHQLLHLLKVEPLTFFRQV